MDRQELENSILAEMNLCLETYADKNSCNLYHYTKGVKKWLFYVCPNCGEVTHFAEGEQDEYILGKTQEEWQNHIVCCSKCSVIGKTRMSGTSEYVRVGRIAEEEPGEVVIATASENNYPDIETQKTCKLEKLKVTDVFAFMEYLEGAWKGCYSELTDWQKLYGDLFIFCNDFEKEVIETAFLYIPFANIEKVRYMEKVILYLVFRENRQFYKVMTEGERICRTYVEEYLEEFLRRLQKSFKEGKKYYTSLKLLVKKKLREEDLQSGEVFTIPFSMVKNAKNLEQISSWRKVFQKAKDKENLEEFLRATQVCNTTGFVNVLRLAVQNTGMKPQEVAKICLLRDLKMYADMEKTAKRISTAGKILEGKKLVWEPDFESVIKVDTSNKFFYQSYVIAKGGDIDWQKREYARFMSILDATKDSCKGNEVQFVSGDLLTLQCDLARIYDICEALQISANRLLEHYKNGTAYAYANDNFNHYAIVAINGSVVEGYK